MFGRLRFPYLHLRLGRRTDIRYHQRNHNSASKTKTLVVQYNLHDQLCLWFYIIHGQQNIIISILISCVRARSFMISFNGGITFRLLLLKLMFRAYIIWFIEFLHERYLVGRSRGWKVRAIEDKGRSNTSSLLTSLSEGKREREERD